MNTHLSQTPRPLSWRGGSVVALALGLLIPTGPAAADAFTFAGFTFEQSNTPDVISLIGGGVNLGGAQFSSQFANSITRSVGFIAASGNANAGFIAAPGWVDGLSLGQQAHTQLGLTQSDGSGSQFSSAINLPRGDNGSSTRHGIEVGWSSGFSLVNGPGDDFVVYESGSNANSPEGFMVRVRDAATGEFSPWYYEMMEGFENYVNTPATNEGAFAVGYDLSDLGIGDGGMIDLIQIANLTSSDRVDPTASSNGFALSGNVRFDNVGQQAAKTNSSTYGSGELDPDPLYVGIIGNLGTVDVNPIPEPGTLALLGFGLAGVAGYRFRRRRTA